jgi:hypothetical protein
MDEIVTSVQRVTHIMNDIATASRKQTAGIEQVNQALSQIDEVTQRNAALVEHAAKAASSMQKQASGLSEAVEVFKLRETDALECVPEPLEQLHEATVTNFPEKRKRNPAAPVQAYFDGRLLLEKRA